MFAKILNSGIRVAGFILAGNLLSNSSSLYPGFGSKDAVFCSGLLL